jgi:hypothetical protein
MDIFLYVLLFWSGAIVGIFLSWWVLARLKSYSGVIIARPDVIENKVMYSLVLFSDPNNLIFEKEVLFKVDISTESVENGNRE